MRVFFSVKFFFICSVFLVKEGKSEALRPQIQAPIAILMNAENGKVLFEKNSHQLCLPASMTKIATALYAIHKKGNNFDQPLTVSSDAVGVVSIETRRNSGKHPSYRLEYGGTHASLKVGEKLDFKTLLYGLMLVSGNDAANVVAEGVSGSVSKFMEEMNVFLKAIGCKNTYYKNPHGLPDPTHLTTAYDLAIMSRVAMKNPLFREVVSSSKYERPQTNKQEPFWYVQKNGLIASGKYHYPYATGIKTGYTIKAGFNITASAQKGDRNLIAVVCGCTENPQRFRTAVQLFEAAFNEPKKERTLLSHTYDLFHKSLEGAKQALHAVLKEDLVVSFYPSEERQFYPKVVWYSLELPIKEGEEVGLVQVFDETGLLEKNAPILAVKAVEPTFSYQVQKKMDGVRVYVKKQRAYFGYGMAFGIFAFSFWLVKRKRLKSGRNRLF